MIIQFNKKNTLTFIILLLITFIARFYDLFTYFQDWDEAELMSISWAMTKGSLLYKEIPQFHPPLQLWTFFIFFKIFSVSIAPLAIKIFNIFILAISSFIITKISVNINRSEIIGFLTGILFSFLMSASKWTASSYAEFYALPFILLSVFLALHSNKLKERQFIYLGVLCGIAVLFKQTSGFDFLILILILHNKNTLNIKNIKKIAFSFMLIIFISCIPFIFQHSLIDYLNSLIIFPLFYSKGIEIPSYPALLNHQILFFIFNNRWVIFISAGYTLLAILYSFIKPAKTRYNISIAVPVLWFISISLFLPFFGRFYKHYIIQLIPSFCLCLALPLNYFSDKLIKIISAILILSLILTSGLNSYLKYDDYDYQNQRSEKIADWIINNTEKDSTIFLFNEICLNIFYLSKRLSPNGIYMYIVMDSKHMNNPVIEKRSRLLLKNNLPDIIIKGFFKTNSESNEAYYFINNLIKKYYEPVREIKSTHIFKIKSL